MMHETITTDSEVFDAYGEQLHATERLLYPEHAADEAVLEVFQKLRNTSKRIVLVDGAFDVPHLNHEWYLRHCKLVGAQALARSGITTARDVLANDSVSLAVTVDADEKIHRKKSNAQKGGVERPIYPWEARALRVAGYAYELCGRPHFVANLVTVEGDSIHTGTVLESSLTLADSLHQHGLLDELVIYGEHGQTIEEANDRHIPLTVISDSVCYAQNPQHGRGYSSSDIIRRAQGEAVPHPITRPFTQ